tara:strand:- start:12 stop:317 length:306 start_codon:yes stop_codon:yes gene_type:complete
LTLVPSALWEDQQQVLVDQQFLSDSQGLPIGGLSPDRKGPQRSQTQASGGTVNRLSLANARIRRWERGESIIESRLDLWTGARITGPSGEMFSRPVVRVRR